jgi:hypothetical protein
METTEKDIEKIMKRKFDTPVPDIKLGKPYGKYLDNLK